MALRGLRLHTREQKKADLGDISNLPKMDVMLEFHLELTDKTAYVPVSS